MDGIQCEYYMDIEYFVCSIFEGKPIPYPKREFLTDDDDDKADSKVRYIRPEAYEPLH